MTDETDEQNQDISWIVIGGYVWSILLIVGPLLLWLGTSFASPIMFGMFIGATIRFATDVLLLVLTGGTGDAENIPSGNWWLAIVSMLVQFGTLVGCAILYFVSGSGIALGVVLAMFAAYLYGAIGRHFMDSDTSESESEEDDSEWQFSVDDVS